MDLNLNPTFLHYSRIISGNLLPDVEAIKDEVSVFTEIQSTLQHLIENQKELPFEVSLLIDHSFVMFLKAGHFVLVGERSVAMATLRIALEASFYAFDIKDDARKRKIWMSRHKDEASKKACRNKFNGVVTRVATQIEENHVSGFSAVAVDLYEAAIDFGAHPNSPALIRNAEVDVKGNMVLLSNSHTGRQHDIVRKYCLSAYIEFGCVITMCWSAILGCQTQSQETIINRWSEKAAALQLEASKLETAYLEEVKTQLEN